MNEADNGTLRSTNFAPFPSSQRTLQPPPPTHRQLYSVSIATFFPHGTPEAFDRQVNEAQSYNQKITLLASAKMQSVKRFAPRERQTDEPTPQEKIKIRFLREQARMLIDETLHNWKRTWTAGLAATPTNKIRLEYMQPQAVVWSNTHQVCLMAYTLAEKGVSVTLDNGTLNKLEELTKTPFRVRQTIKYSKNLETKRKEGQEVYWQFLHVEQGNNPQLVVEAMWVQKGYRTGDVTMMDLRKRPGTSFSSSRR